MITLTLMAQMFGGFANALIWLAVAIATLSKRPLILRWIIMAAVAMGMVALAMDALRLLLWIEQQGAAK